jgi:hypothetical protein
MIDPSFTLLAGVAGVDISQTSGLAARVADVQAIVTSQFASVQNTSPIKHPFPALPDKIFEYFTCDYANPYLLVTVQDQEVPVVVPYAQVNTSEMAFAINSWAEIQYQDPKRPQFKFSIAEDVIYDVGRDSFAVATPFDTKGQLQPAGVSTIGHDGIYIPGKAGSDSNATYNIKFTFLASPLASRKEDIKPVQGFVPFYSGELDDAGPGGRAYTIFTELVARLYFNVVTAALGNECNPGYGTLLQWLLRSQRI